MSVAVKGVDRGDICVTLERRARERKMGAVAQIAAGLVLTVGMPAVLATAWVVASRGGGLLLWPVLFLFGLVVLMPIAYVMEWMTQGGYLMRRLREIENCDGGWCEAITRDRTWRWDARRDAAQWEMMLFVPRMVFGGVATLRGIKMVGAAEPGEVANLLAKLVSEEHGVAVEDLRHAGEDALALGRVISFLLFYEWVGVSENGRKVWALSETRDELLRRG